MQSPNSDLLQALYTQLDDNLSYNVYQAYVPDFVTPAVVITQFENAEDNAFNCSGSNNTFLIECVKDFTTSISKLDLYAIENDVVQYLTENKLILNNQNDILLTWINSVDQFETLANGAQRGKRLLRFRILLQQK